MFNSTVLTMPTVVSIHGLSGSGKTTLADSLANRGGPKTTVVTLGRLLRKDTYAALGLSQVADERAPFSVALPEGSVLGAHGDVISLGSFKEGMVKVARIYRACDPYRYIRAADTDFYRASAHSQMVVFSDCRTAPELDWILSLGCPTLIIEIKRDDPSVHTAPLDRRLDNHPEYQSRRRPLLNNGSFKRLLDSAEELILNEFC